MTVPPVTRTGTVARATPTETTDRVLRDLVDALLFENLLGFADRAAIVTGSHPDLWPDLPLAGDEQWLVVELPGGGMLGFRACPAAALQRWVLSRPPVLLVRAGRAGPVPVDAPGLLAALAGTTAATSPAWPNLPSVLGDLSLAAEQAARSAATVPALLSDLDRPRPGLVAWERWTALRDRPFHPTACAKRGWSAAEQERYAPEFGRTFRLSWVAVPHEAVAGTGGPQGPVELLERQQERRLRAGMTAAGIDPAGHVPIPVHPWQRRHVVSRVFRGELEAGVVRAVPVTTPGFVATSSGRTVVPSAGGSVHFKLPLGIRSLGALRALPARYLYNGGCGTALLEELRARSPGLNGSLAVCDERAWWAFCPPGEEPLDHRHAQLGCALRRYPQELLHARDTELVPMGALAVASPDGSLPALGAFAGTLASEPAALVGRVAELLAGVCLNCFARGVMPEVHGQNVVLVLGDGTPRAVLLRDHDTVRIHPAWTERAGLTPPPYRLKPGTPNTLVLADPRSLLGWFQTLGVEVNLAAIADAFARAFPVDPRLLWDEIARAVRRAIATAELPSRVATVARAVLLECESWPSKLVLGPLLEGGAGEASMPSGTGRIPNPLLTRRAG